MKNEKRGKNPRDMKIGMKNRIMAMMASCPKGIEAHKLVAMLELETGFNEKNIRHVLENMETVELISVNAGIVTAYTAQ